MSDQELRQLLQPITPELFLERYWEREPLYIRGTPEKVDSLFDRAAFDRAVAEHQTRNISIRVSLDHEQGPRGASLHIPIRANEIDGYLARGASVCADPIDNGDAKLAAYAARLRQQLNHCGSVTVKAYLSSDGYGFNTHFDKQIATTLQIEGKKRWRYSPKPAVPFPLHNGLLGTDGATHYVGRRSGSLEPWEHLEPVDESNFLEVTLEPGDILCLPAGTWHNAKAIGHSLALNVSFAPLTAFTLFYNAMQAVLTRNPEWRRNLPAFLGSVPSGDVLPSELHRFFSQRVEDLQEMLAQLDPSSAPVADAWKRAFAAVPDPHAVRPAFVTLPRETRPQPQVSRTSDEVAKPHGYDGRLTCAFCVSNLDAAIAWYQNVLGFTLRYQIDTFGWGEMETGINGVTLGLSERQEEPGPSGASLILGVTDLDATRSRLEAMDVRFEGATQVIHGVIKLAPFYDPDGNRLMLSQTL